MGSKRRRSLAWTAVVAILVASAAPSEARSIPFFGKSVCKEEKQKLANDERILRDRHQLAFDQCRAGAGGEKSQRCLDLKQQQKAELQKSKDQKQRTLDDCKQRAEGQKGDHKGK